MAVDHTILISIDSLNRHFLDAYEGEVEFDVQTPNIDRFADRATVFDSHYAGSLPCMPARREWLTGTKGFLWRPWGPIEPFDVTLPAALRKEDVTTQLVTDHYHYFRHGSSGYYEDFDGFEFVRGHEADHWRTLPDRPDERLVSQITPGVDPGTDDYETRVKYARNVDRVDELDETDFFASKVFRRAATWVQKRRELDKSFLYVDSFDVHEPFHCPEPYASMYTDEDPTDPDLPSWPLYGRIDEDDSELSERQVSFVRSQFAGKLSMVDRWFGRLLDALDRIDAWDDTLVIVTSDHGHYLGEHGWMGKPSGAPIYDVLAKTPLFIHHPDARLDRVDELTTAVDVNPTVLDGFGMTPEAPHGRSLVPLLVEDETDHREYVLYGYWGSSVNVTDGRYTYHHPANGDVTPYCYSTTMMNPNEWFETVSPKENPQPTDIPYAECPVWKYPGHGHDRNDTPLLFDTATDSKQETDISEEAPERMADLRGALVARMQELGAPSEQFDRLDLSPQPE